MVSTGRSEKKHDKTPSLNKIAIMFHACPHYLNNGVPILQFVSRKKQAENNYDPEYFIITSRSSSKTQKIGYGCYNHGSDTDWMVHNILWYQVHISIKFYYFLLNLFESASFASDCKHRFIFDPRQTHIIRMVEP